MGKVEQLWGTVGRAFNDETLRSETSGSRDLRLVGGARREADRSFATPATADASTFGVASPAVVKWFNAEKGYGFVELADGRGDAFLHLKTLRLVGRETLPSGAKLRAIISEGPRGAQVTRVVEVDISSIVERTERASRRPPHDPSTAIDLTGKVKWFDGARGFGFVASDDFGRDVFIHSSTLGASGVSRLFEGQAVAMRVVETPKGREAISIIL